MRQNNHAFLLFLAGLFSLTRINIGGSIAITEIVMVFLSPLLFIRNVTNFKRDGIMPLLIFCLLWLGGAVLSDIINDTNVRFALKGIATPIVYFAGIVCMYVLLRRDPRNLKWYVLGAAFSYVVSTFYFQRAASFDVEVSAESALERTIDYKLYWITLADHFLLLPIRGWFAATPFMYSGCAVLCLAISALCLGARSMFATFAVSFTFIVIGGKTLRSMVRLKRHMLMIAVLMCCVMVVAKVVYKDMAISGMLGEGERHKYEYQTKAGDSALQMLMSGRSEFFVGIFAAKDHPIVGRGSWAIDKDEIWPEFVRRYGSLEDYEVLAKAISQYGYSRYIPFHSHIVTYWMWHGIFGLFFWLYVLCLVIKTLFRGMYVNYEHFGFFALAIPAFMWDIFFSPAGLRVYESMLFVLCALVVTADRHNLKG